MLLNILWDEHCGLSQFLEAGSRHLIFTCSPIVFDNLRTPAIKKTCANDHPTSANLYGSSSCGYLRFRLTRPLDYVCDVSLLFQDTLRPLFRSPT